jgi:putative molybdopterin biosynthesis protein
MKEKKQLLTPDEVAAMLQIARKTVVVMAREGRIPCVRVGKLVRFDPADIERWINGQRS